MIELGDRYHEIMAFRTEALGRYRANVLSMVSGPPSELCLPVVGFVDDGLTIKRIGPFRFADKPPIAPHVVRILKSAKRPLRILEIGPGTGALATMLHRGFASSIRDYFAIDRDRSVSGAFTVVSTIDELPGEIDLVIAAEVIEHMSSDVLYATFLAPLLSKLSPDATFVLSTPNPLAPGGIARDFTHTQRYPWYDLYAVFRLAFRRVDIYRTHYLFSFRRLLQIVPRFILCLLLELEWCDTLICVAKQPRSEHGAAAEA